MSVYARTESLCRAFFHVASKYRNYARFCTGGSTAKMRFFQYYSKQICRILQKGVDRFKSTESEKSPVLGVVVAAGFFSMFEQQKKDPVEEHVRAGHIAMKRQEFKEAENFYHLALHTAKQELKLKNIDPKRHQYIKIYVYDSLGKLALQSGELDKAEKLFKETMKLCLQNNLFKMTDNAVVELSMRLAGIYASQGKDLETQEGYNYCIATQEQKLKENENCSNDTYALLGMCLESYAKYLTVKHHYDKALELLNRSAEVSAVFLGEDHPQNIVLLNDIASVHILKKDYEEAEKLLKKALKMGIANKDPSLPNMYCNLGALYMAQGNYEEALSNCKKCQKLGMGAKNQEAMRQAHFCIQKCVNAKAAK